MSSPSNAAALVRREEARAIREGSRSFYLASRLFGSTRREEIAALYRFCRWVDDLADESASVEQAEAELTAVRDELDGRRPPRAPTASFLALAERRSIDPALAHALIDGMASDLVHVRMSDDHELLRYCYRAAGTVGLMMCRVLGVEDKDADSHAIDLGIAMQLTNICRDVAEDAGRGRVYLPADRLAAGNLAPDRLTAGGEIDGPTRAAVRRVVLDLLDLADRYYHSGEAGLVFLPGGARLGVLVASRVYREIGTLLRERSGDALAGRAVVSGVRKVRVGVGACFDVLSTRRRGPHDQSLHAALRGLPMIASPGGQA